MYDHCAVGKVKRGEPRRDSERSDKADSVTEDILEKYRGTSAKPPVSSSGASGMCILLRSSHKLIKWLRNCKILVLHTTVELPYTHYF